MSQVEDTANAAAPCEIPSDAIDVPARRTPADLVALQCSFDRAIEKLESLTFVDPALRRHLVELRNRLVSQRPHLAVLGQFKRGKSTLLNALLGDELLPVSVVPVTALPIFIDYGPEKLLRISYIDGRQPEEFGADAGDDLAFHLWRVSAEESNPRNRLGVARVELRHPASLLREGVTLVDTPGVGSTFQHNTQAALDFLSDCDAAIFVVSADPPITANEIEYLSAVRTHVSKLFFVLNKIDYLDETNRNVAVQFLQRTLTDHGLPDNTFEIFRVSARDALAAVRVGDHALLERSGLPALQRHLGGFLLTGKAALLEAALGTKAEAALSAALFQADVTLRALELPLEDLQKRAEKFEVALRQIERERIAAQDLLKGDLKRALELLEADAQEIRERMRRRIEEEIEGVSARSPLGQFEADVGKAVADAIRHLFPREFGDLSKLWDRRLRESFAGHRQRASALVDSVRRTAADLFDIPFSSGPASGGLDDFRRPHWNTGEIKVTLDPLHQALTDRLTPPAVRRRRQKARAAMRSDDLIRRNVESLRWATVQNINESFRRFSIGLDDELQEAVRTTHGAILSAQEKRRVGAKQTEKEIERLRAAQADLAALKMTFAQHANE